MTNEPAIPGDAHALRPVNGAAHGHPTHDHGHDHNHGHSHAHAHGAHRHTHSHVHAPASPAPSATTPRPPRISLLMHSAALRLAGAVALSALLWAAVAWALSGTP